MLRRVDSPGAVVIGGYVNALGLVRALGERGLRVAVVRTKPFDVAHRSRWCGAHEAALDLHERSGALAEVLLERRARDWRGWTLIPACDEGIAAVAEHRERLDSGYRVVAPHPDAARYLLDKSLMWEAARAAGLDVPARYGAGEAARFPAVVKPLASYRFAARFGTKVGVARDPRELERWFARMDGIPGAAFEVVPGGDDAIVCSAVFLDERSRPLASCTLRKLRQGPPGFGDARVARIVDDDPRLREATVEVARRIGLRGVAVAEFKRDARDGRLRFIEINGRSVVYNAALRRAGFDIAGLSLGERPAGASGWRGTWAHLHPDVLYSLRERLGRARFMAPYRGPWMEAVWSRRDPVPFVAQWARPPRRGTSPLAARAPRGG
jgi:predicted ATP-grasp superfamily ATP-dependent carboligase